MKPKPRMQQRPPLLQERFERMLTTLLRLEGPFLAARKNLDARGFATNHRGFAILWRLTGEHYDQFGELPGEDELAYALQQHIDVDPQSLSDEEIAELNEFITYAWTPNPEHLKPHVAFRWLRQYLDDRLISRARDDLADPNRTPASTFRLFQDYALQASAIEAIEPKAVDVPFPAGWDAGSALRLETIKTGLPMIDGMLQGGMGRKEVILLLGPNGSMKTTLAIQVSTDVAIQARAQWKDAGRAGPLGFTYLFIYEGTINEMRTRALSHAGRISRAALQIGDPRHQLSRRRLKPYEQQIFANVPAHLRQGEFDRYRIAQRQLNDNWRVLDMTGNDLNHPGRGWGLVDEIAAILAHERQHHQEQGIEHRVDLVVVDYAGAAVDRHVEQLAQQQQYDKFVAWNTLLKMPLQVKNKLAVPFDCPVLLIHQLDAAANSLVPGRVAQGTNAEGAKNLRRNVDFCFVVGSFDLNQRAVIRMDKQRRAAPTQERVIELLGDISTLRGTDGRYVYDPTSKKIVEAQLFHSVRDDEDRSPYGVGDMDAQNEQVHCDDVYYSPPVQN